MTSDEVENISIVVAALGTRDDLHTLLRAGRGDVVNETSSLFKIASCATSTASAARCLRRRRSARR
ncbi:MAG: hypothetical protein H0V57_07550 [Thermoleophilaceae bacterium]|nr:hypothetical protein [Thermoleophilaceae bacterium]